jgi:hypothetical protein
MVGKEAAKEEESDVLNTRGKTTARIACITVNVAICRTFLRWVLTVIITRVRGSIARISQIATAGPTSEIGVLAGFLDFNVSAVGAVGIPMKFT